MKLDKLVGERFKEKPSDCIIESHALTVRGGYIKNVANGIYSSYMPMRRITKKIEQIIREEMDRIDGQEVQFPVVMPATLWEESGRYESIGSELLRFSDRNKSPMVLGMTHEEAAVHLVRDYANSYNKYPFMIYQIQTKFRDEGRPRAGLIRVREFTMKDAYSFHTSQEDLEQYYDRCYDAYNRIFARCGIPEVVTVKSDSGMMGGSVSHEYMLLTAAGEDTIAVCSECDFRANIEAAPCIVENEKDAVLEELTLVHTPDMHTIDEVCTFLNSAVEKSCKAVVYQRNADDTYIVAFVRGDLEVNETKLRNAVGCEIHPAEITDGCGLIAGFIGPYNMDERITVVIDGSLKGATNLTCGGNKLDYHYTGFNIDRDLGEVEYMDVAAIKDGGICPQCGKHSVTLSRGIEVGNIFQLGTKYTKSMGMTYLDSNGQEQYPIMGCYGIGVGRLAASVCEAYHDNYGPIWPMSIAPWQVHLCCVRSDDAATKECADKLYEEMQNAGIEVIYDDRKVSAGYMFSDADLLGVPLRVIASPRNLKENCCEIVSRDKTISQKTEISEVIDTLKKLISDMMK